MFQPGPWAMPPQPLIQQPINKHGIKRKPIGVPDEIVTEPPPLKRFLTEEEMAVEMMRLNIEEQVLRQNAVPVYNTEQQQQAPYVFNTTKFAGFGVQTDESDSMELEPIKDPPRLYLSAELSQLKPEPIIPEILIASNLKNQMAIVPWVPRTLPLSTIDQKDDKDEEKTEILKSTDVMDLMNID